MPKTIGFNANERLRLLADALANRLGYGNTSKMLRALLEAEIEAEFSKQEQEEIIRLNTNPKTGQIRNFAVAGRRGKKQVAQQQ